MLKVQMYLKITLGSFVTLQPIVWLVFDPCWKTTAMEGNKQMSPSLVMADEQQQLSL